MKRGVIINPRSGRRGKGLELASLLKPHPDIAVHVLEEFGSLRPILAAMAAAEIAEIFISSGDGTVQAVQTCLAEEGEGFAALPRLCLLPHGTTNMTAADLGFRAGSISAQADFIAGRAASEVNSRPTLRIANPADGKIRHGMFLGAGAVTAAARFCQDAVHRSGLEGDWAAFATLSAALGRAVFSRHGRDDSGRIDRPHPIRMQAGNQTIAEGAQLLFLASTLDRLILGTRPFWGGKDGPLRVTLLPHPVPGIFRWLLPLMYGGETRAAPPGAVSWSGDRFSVETPSPFVLDGEFFDAPAASPLRVEAGPSFSYIRR